MRWLYRIPSAHHNHPEVLLPMVPVLASGVGLHCCLPLVVGGGEPPAVAIT